MSSELSEVGKQEAVAIIEKFKAEMGRVALSAIESALDDTYRDILPYIETDSWFNFRKAIVDGICGYEHGGLADQYDFKRMRQAILREHRDELVQDLNQDLLNEVADLKQRIDYLNGVRP